MMFWVFALFLGSLTEAATIGVSPVQKVIELLDGLKGKVQAELEAEEGLMSEFTKWCDTEANEKEDSITSAKRTTNELSAAIQSASGDIDALSSEADTLASKISTAEADLASASYIRKDERGSLEASEKELTETVDTLARAMVVLKRGQTFLQQKGASEEMKALAEGLEKVVQATWVSSNQKSVVQSLLQSEDEDLSLQPQATAAAFESKGGGILDVIGDLQNKAEASLSTQRKGEMQAKHTFSMLEQSINTELAQMKKRMAAATNERSSNQEQMHSDETELSETQKSLQADKTYLQDMRNSCAAKSAEWGERQKSASAEVAAIDKARSILADGVKVFLQVASDGVSTAKRTRVAELLRGIAKKNKFYQLAQLAASVESDPFGKVRDMISTMVDRLMKEAGEEADSKAFCDTEISKSRAKQADLSAKDEMHGVRIERGAASKAKLEEQIKHLQTETAEIDETQAVATSLRAKENTNFKKSTAEYQESGDAVNNAIQVLEAYYSQGAFAQVKQAPEFDSAKSDIGTTITEMLEVAAADFARLLAEARAAETAAQTSFDDLSQKNAVSKSAKLEEAKGKEDQIKQLEMSLVNYKEDKVSTTKELDATMEYLEKLKPQCETKVMSFAERSRRREDEIAGLKEALAILEG